MVWKKVINADSGDADHHGGDSLDKVSDLFSGVDVDDVDINCDWNFRSGKLNIRNPANTFSYNVVGAALAATRTLNLPLLTGTDTVVVTGLAQTLSNKTLDSTNVISSSASLPSDAVRTSRENTYDAAYNQIFHSGRLHLLTPDNNGKYWIHGQNLDGEYDLVLPLITDTVTYTEYLVGIKATQTLSNKVLDATCDVSDAIGSSSGTGIGTQSGATVDINTTSAETDLLNYTVVGSDMCPNGSAVFLISGYLLQNQATGTTYTFAVKFGGTTMWADVSPTIAQSATKIPFRIQGEVFNKNATNAQGLSGFIRVNDTTAATTGLGDISSDTNTSPPAFSGNFDSEGADTTKDTTIDQVLQVTVTMSVSNSATHTVVKHKQVEVKNAS